MVFFKGKVNWNRGLNEDPYTENNKIGRLRRFYISKDYRRIGLGSRY